MLRIDFDELEASDDYLTMLYQGEPFNGVAFELAPDGVLIAETTFSDGQKSGISREWSRTGILIREATFGLDALHGIFREWHSGEHLKREGQYELGICIREREWDEGGNLIRDYTIDESSPEFSTLQKLRTSNLGLIVNNSQQS